MHVDYLVFMKPHKCINVEVKVLFTTVNNNFHVKCVVQGLFFLVIYNLGGVY